MISGGKPYWNIALKDGLGLICEILAALSSCRVTSNGIRNGAISGGHFD